MVCIFIVECLMFFVCLCMGMLKLDCKILIGSGCGTRRSSRFCGRRGFRGRV